MSSAAVVSAITGLENAIKQLAERRAQSVRINHISFPRNVAMGGAMCYAIQNEKVWHLPFIFLFASPYVGYQMYKNQDKVMAWVGEQMVRLG